jgi:hypothetical protein
VTSRRRLLAHRPIKHALTRDPTVSKSDFIEPVSYRPAFHQTAARSTRKAPYRKKNTDAIPHQMATLRLN